MKKTHILLLTLIVFNLLLSCSYHIRKLNNENLKKLSVGMSKKQVLAIMGKPLENEVYNTNDVWYYFTQVKWSDGSITRDECSPVYFENNKLVGWGTKEYKKFRQKDW